MADVATVEIYTSMFCGYCVRAKKLLSQKGVSFTEKDVTADKSGRTLMTSRAGGRTSVPQIFINGDHIGGCDELFTLERSGTLDKLLSLSA
jgi:glutaredoxin 3